MALPTTSTVSADALLEAGYTRFHDPYSAAVLRHSYLGSFQLRVVDVDGVRYTVAICHGLKIDGAAAGRGEYFCPEVQFRRRGVLFNVEMLWRGQSIAEIETFFEDIWLSMELDHIEVVDAPSLHRSLPH